MGEGLGQHCGQPVGVAAARPVPPVKVGPVAVLIPRGQQAGFGLGDRGGRVGAAYGGGDERAARMYSCDHR